MAEKLVEAFQLTSSRRGWRCWRCNRCSTSTISTHILTKRMTIISLLCIFYCWFQLTSSRRGWRYIYSYVLWVFNFNSHPHEEDDAPPPPAKASIIISTHILTKRMTFLHRDGVLIILFQLTSSRRGWLQANFLFSHLHNNFNSHPHEEDDLIPRLQVWYRQYFNSHPHEEDDYSEATKIYEQVNFNSHPHEEDDFPSGCVAFGSIHFNSHPHEEDDETGTYKLEYKSISTHILTKRMTSR